MSEHWPDWPDGHDDPAGHHDDTGYPADDADHPGPDDLAAHPGEAGDDWWADDGPPVAGHDDVVAGDDGDGDAPGYDADHGDGDGNGDGGDAGALPGETRLGPVGADPDALPEPAADAGFPPPVDVGTLPEPVDGFPWTDAQTLGAAALGDPVPGGAPDPGELAAYAGTEVPPGAEGWAALTDSDDPAVAALAKWWTSGR